MPSWLMSGIQKTKTEAEVEVKIKVEKGIKKREMRLFTPRSNLP
jgi:hypothetical protein